jgi:hypothetical protein
MEDTIVSRTANGYRATANGRTVATGETQNEAGWEALQKRPNAAVVAQRVKTTENGYPDEFRRMYPTKPRR